MAVIIDGTAGIANNATDLSYTGTLTGGTGVVNLGSGQVYKDASGNVGIGTSSPAEKLVVAATSNNAGRFTSTATTTALVLDNTNANGWGSNIAINTGGTAAGYFGTIGSLLGSTSQDLAVYATTGNSVRFYTNGNNERARIDSSGNLLVGTTSAGGDGISCRVRNSGGGTSSITFNRASSATIGYPVVFQNAGTDVGFISQTNTTTAYVTSSDYRLKNTIAPMTGALAKVAALRPCTYKWKVDGSDGQGFIAHELAEVEAGCVTGEKDAVDAEGNPQYQGIDTSFLVATLTAAIQEQQALITALTTRITALEAK